MSKPGGATKKLCKACARPLSPHRPTHPSHGIRQWLDKYKKSNNKNKKNILDFSYSYPAIPAAPLPKASKKLPKRYQKGTTNIEKASKKHPKTLPDPTPEKVTKKTPLFVFMLPLVTKIDPQRHPEITKNSRNSIIFSVRFPKNFDTLCCHLFSSSGVPRSSEMSLKHSACHAFRATPKMGKFSKFFQK